MSKHSYRSFDKKEVAKDDKPKSFFSSSIGEVKDIDELYKEPDLDEKNEVAAEPEVEEIKIESVKYKEKKYDVKDMWHNGEVTVLSNMRKEPNMDSTVLEILSPGATIEINEKKEFGDFYKIRHQGHIGYLKMDLCKITF